MESQHIPPETSYQAAYSGEAHRSIGPHQGGIASASTNIQPASVPRPVVSTVQAGPSYNPLVLRDIQHDKAELSTLTKGQVSILGYWYLKKKKKYKYSQWGILFVCFLQIRDFFLPLY